VNIKASFQSGCPAQGR